MCLTRFGLSVYSVTRSYASDRFMVGSGNQVSGRCIFELAGAIKPGRFFEGSEVSRKVRKHGACRVLVAKGKVGFCLVPTSSRRDGRRCGIAGEIIPPT